MLKALNKIPFKSFDKIKEHIKTKYPLATDKEIREALKKKVKDRFIKMKEQRKSMIKIFSPTTKCWFHDLFDNGSNPKYYHIFIGMNNRYVHVNPLQDKKTDSVLESYKIFCEKYKPFKLTSDQDSSLLSEACLDYLKSQDVLVQSIPDQNHSALGIIDRFIRTLRDMHGSNTAINLNE